jgi:hypothetical protein
MENPLRMFCERCPIFYFQGCKNTMFHIISCCKQFVLCKYYVLDALVVGVHEESQYGLSWAIYHDTVSSKEIAVAHNHCRWYELK